MWWLHEVAAFLLVLRSLYCWWVGWLAAPYGGRMRGLYNTYRFSNGLFWAAFDIRWGRYVVCEFGKPGFSSSVVDDFGNLVKVVG